MTPQHLYRIKKSFIIPLALDTLLLFILLTLSCLGKGSAIERGVLAMLFLVAVFVLFEASRRSIRIEENGFYIQKFFRTKMLNWSDLTHVGCLILRSRVYILLTTKRGFYVISNAYDRFSALVQALISHVPSDDIEVEESAKAQIHHPVRNISDIIAVWVAAAVLTAIIGLKISS